MEERAYTGAVVNVRTVEVLEEDTIFNRVWQPYVEQWDDNHLIVAWGHQLNGKTDMGDLVCAVTRDGGNTWSAPIMIFDHRALKGPRRYAYANAALYRAPGQGIVWCFGMRCPLHVRDSENSELVAAYSSDGGFSWMQVELANHFLSPLITCSAPFKFKDRYLLPIHRNTIREDPLGDARQFVLESTDLIRWNLAGYVPFDPDSPVFLHEAGIAQTGEEEISLVMRTATYGYKNYSALPTSVAYRTRSMDGGRTWSVAEPELSLHNTCSKSYYGMDGKGQEIYVYSPGPKNERKAMYYCLRPREGEWSEPRVFYDGNNRNSYPVLVEKPGSPGEFLCVWDSSNDPDVKRSVIRFGEFNTAEG